MKLEVIRWNEPVKPRERPLTRRLEDEGFGVFRWRDGAGAEYPSHAHDHDESLWVIQGEITFDIAADRHTLKPGDRLMLQGNRPHGVHRRRGLPLSGRAEALGDIG